MEYVWQKLKSSNMWKTHNLWAGLGKDVSLSQAKHNTWTATGISGEDMEDCV